MLNSMDADSKFLFSSDDGALWTRELHGLERLAAAFFAADGFPQLMFIGSIGIKQDIDQDSLVRLVKSAWIRLRFTAPWLAVRTSVVKGENSKSNSFMYTYDASNNPQKTADWADETVISERRTQSLDEWELEIKDRFWTPNENRFGMELHIAPDVDKKWFFIFTMGHWVVDVRGGTQVFDRFFQLLETELNPGSELPPAIPWGEETARLPPTVIKTVAVSSSPALEVESEPPAVPDHTPVLFSRAQVSTDDSNISGHSTVLSTVTLSRAQTSAFLAECKSSRLTITSAVNSILLLAEVETALSVSFKSSHQEFQDTLQSLRTSDVLAFTMNTADMRGLHGVEHTGIDASKGLPGFAMTVFPTMHDMTLIRKCINCSDDGKITKDLSQANFWTGLVGDTQRVVRANAKATPESYVASQYLFDAAAETFNPNSLTVPGIMCSSVGSLDAMAVFPTFRPSSTSTVTVDDVRFAVRMTKFTGQVLCQVWTYEGALTMHLQGAKRWHSQATMDMFAEAVRANIEQVSSPATVA